MAVKSLEQAVRDYLDEFYQDDLSGWLVGRPHLTTMTDLLTAAQVAEAAADALLDATGPSPIADLDWTQTVQTLAVIRSAIDTLRDLDALLVTHAYKTRPGRYAEVEGLGRVETSRSSPYKKWDERGVAQAVLDAHLENTDGIAPDPWTVVEWLLEVYGVQYCRVGALQALGLKPDNYAERQQSKPVVTFSR